MFINKFSSILFDWVIIQVVGKINKFNATLCLVNCVDLIIFLHSDTSVFNFTFFSTSIKYSNIDRI